MAETGETAQRIPKGTAELDKRIKEVEKKVEPKPAAAE